MTDCPTKPAAAPEPNSERIERALFWLLVGRVLLALAAIGLVFFLLRWSSAVRRETVPTPQSQRVPDEWKVVVPEYAGGGRGSTLISVKPWRFGTMQEHPVAVGFWIFAVVIMAGAFAACTWQASQLKLRMGG